ncbi:MAG TPA: hypothetical protein VN441_02070, partial [Syntrophomonas sp.]|nr:hypothetical protein [Syntrophomonas sp.]
LYTVYTHKTQINYSRAYKFQLLYAINGSVTVPPGVLTGKQAGSKKTDPCFAQKLSIFFIIVIKRLKQVKATVLLEIAVYSAGDLL